MIPEFHAPLEYAPVPPKTSPRRTSREITEDARSMTCVFRSRHVPWSCLGPSQTLAQGIVRRQEAKARAVAALTSHVLSQPGLAPHSLVEMWVFQSNPSRETPWVHGQLVRNAGLEPVAPNVAQSRQPSRQVNALEQEERLLKVDHVTGAIPCRLHEVEPRVLRQIPASGRVG